MMHVCATAALEAPTFFTLRSLLVLRTGVEVGKGQGYHFVLMVARQAEGRGVIQIKMVHPIESPLPPPLQIPDHHDHVAQGEP